jgi:hypothetical protein
MYAMALSGRRAPRKRRAEFVCPVRRWAVNSLMTLRHPGRHRVARGVVALRVEPGEYWPVRWAALRLGPMGVS